MTGTKTRLVVVCCVVVVAEVVLTLPLFVLVVTNIIVEAVSGRKVTKATHGVEPAVHMARSVNWFDFRRAIDLAIAERT